LLTDPGAHGADPADAFDVVVPDMPGYGYSDRPTGAPLDAIAVADLWAELMAVLGAATSRSTTPTGWSPSTARTRAELVSGQRKAVLAVPAVRANQLVTKEELAFAPSPHG
jgi:pimeloyl-ACP methyl ester carboxylesterase